MVNPANANIEYGVPEFAWYARAVPSSAKRVLILGNFGGKGTRRARDREPICPLIRDALVKFIAKSTGKPTFAVDDGGQNHDFAILATAPTLIGSMSTFSLYAALCNRYGKVILPAAAIFGFNNYDVEDPVRGPALAANAISSLFKRITFVTFRHGIQSGDPAWNKPSADILDMLETGKGDWKG